MKTLFRRSLTTFMCVGTLIAGTQSWAADTTQSNSITKTKVQEKCQKPCDMKKEGKTQKDRSQDENMSNMSQMDHSKMTNMDHSSMMNMDHSKMGDMDHSKMNMSDTSNK
ncbi:MULTISPECIES: hypothetical protein [Acinetobacter]|uniref:hypothetical protein n=1 Tax=Acinetobacter TaxID=469 RepID=UPI001F0703B2|nr:MULTISPECIES: hypothetical protein [Acinetobacter]MCH2003687.1 hypothetical protein [Acinetobacter seifertii]WQF74968.1 hypothetical protein OKW95_19725 [Acinetobacter oleivorans]